MKLGSEFLKEFENYEKPIFGNMTKKNLILFVGIGLVGVFNIGLTMLGVPQLLLFILSIPMVVPILIYSSNKKDELLERWRFQYTIQERPYLTEDGKEKKYSKHDFIQSKTVKEAIQDGETTQSPS